MIIHRRICDILHAWSAKINYVYFSVCLVFLHSYWELRQLLFTKYHCRFPHSDARAVTISSKFHHITPNLKSLNLRKINQRLEYKVLSFIYKILLFIKYFISVALIFFDFLVLNMTVLLGRLLLSHSIVPQLIHAYKLPADLFIARLDFCLVELTSARLTSFFSNCFFST